MDRAEKSTGSLWNTKSQYTKEQNVKLLVLHECRPISSTGKGKESNLRWDSSKKEICHSFSLSSLSACEKPVKWANIINVYSQANQFLFTTQEDELCKNCDRFLPPKKDIAPKSNDSFILLLH